MPTPPGRPSCPPAPLGAMTSSLPQPPLLSRVSLEDLEFFFFSELSFSLAVKMKQCFVFVFVYLIFFLPPEEANTGRN